MTCWDWRRAPRVSAHTGGRGEKERGQGTGVGFVGAEWGVWSGF
jgi:hypothetical protein